MKMPRFFVALITALVTLTGCTHRRSSTSLLDNGEGQPAFQRPADSELIGHVQSLLRDVGVVPAYLDDVQQRRDSIPVLDRYPLANMTGFLKPLQFHGVSDMKSAATIAKFIQKNRKSFAKAERRYGVKAAAIGSLLYVETRLGRLTGRHNVESVLWSIAALSDQTYCNFVQSLWTDPLTEEEKTRLKSNCKIKSDWAQREIASYALLWSERKNPSLGSFSGAYGLPQFLPSSSLKFAAGNLYTPKDAIPAVARFLEDAGWKEDNEESKVAALYQYNRSKSYGQAILSLSTLVESLQQKPSKRVKSGTVSPP